MWGKLVAIAMSARGDVSSELCVQRQSAQLWPDNKSQLTLLELWRAQPTTTRSSGVAEVNSSPVRPGRSYQSRKSRVLEPKTVATRFFPLSLCAAMADQLRTRAFRTLVQHVANGSATGEASWPARSIRDISRALTDLQIFISEDLPWLVGECFDAPISPNFKAEQWIIDFSERMWRQLIELSGRPTSYDKISCLRDLEEDFSWTVTHIWLEWKHFLTPPTWVFADRSTYTTWRSACAPKLAITSEERDALRLSAEVFASVPKSSLQCQDSHERARLVQTLIEDIPLDEHRSETVWWTGCPPSASPHFPDSPLDDSADAEPDAVALAARAEAEA